MTVHAPIVLQDEYRTYQYADPTGVFDPAVSAGQIRWIAAINERQAAQYATSKGWLPAGGQVMDPVATARCLADPDGARSIDHVVKLAAHRWSAVDDLAAMREGWSVFDNSERGLEIERVDDMELDGQSQGARFESDDQAIAYVYYKAQEGSALHQKALALTLTQMRDFHANLPAPMTLDDAAMYLSSRFIQIGREGWGATWREDPDRAAETMTREVLGAGYGMLPHKVVEPIIERVGQMLEIHYRGHQADTAPTPEPDPGYLGYFVRDPAPQLKNGSISTPAESTTPSNQITEQLMTALRALTTTARTFRNVPVEDQQWTTLDDEALDAAFEALDAYDAIHGAHPHERAPNVEDPQGPRP